MDKIVICKQCGKPEYWGGNEMAVGKMYLQELLQSKLAGRESLLIYMG